MAVNPGTGSTLELPYGDGTYQFDVPDLPDLQELQSQYLSNIPQQSFRTPRLRRTTIQTDPNAFYEDIMGPVRREHQEGVQEGALSLQRTAASGGGDYGALLARYLGPATSGLAKASGQAGAASEQMSQQAKIHQADLDAARSSQQASMEQVTQQSRSTAEMQRQQIGNQMAAVDLQVQADRQKMMDQIKYEAYQLDRQIRSTEQMQAAQLQKQWDIAKLQATTQKEIAELNNQYAMKMAQLQQDGESERQRFALESQERMQQFSEAQNNWRHSQYMSMIGRGQDASQIRTDWGGLQGAAQYALGHSYGQGRGDDPRLYNTRYQGGGGGGGNLSISGGSSPGAVPQGTLGPGGGNVNDEGYITGGGVWSGEAAQDLSDYYGGYPVQIGNTQYNPSPSDWVNA